MRRSKAEIYLHFVWATHQRLPFLEPGIQQAVYACILSLVNACKCEALAIGGVEDHVHLLVKAPTTISPSEIMQRVKGASSTLVREQLAPGKLFGWQEGYGVFSVSRSHVGGVCRGNCYSLVCMDER